ncbi:DUF4291 domain-containing protein [Haliscomenobacter hydrossis]|uniref:DUF4291 domain-containing protein n=1 Tax=Haliscomenobacter hydrossis (strain ATCC 27775 / DSM 1100 / LMG 10767 / O) TaxID=760192 RepID=F4KQ42_HALH1|nr:DUF4291 domain-containing protein [Haliscomenobacter hydrossis]AEE54203.1 hypothetical protein Halhy_6384 [Haliscomenobacter hydrossis DSM 1100]
MCTNIIGYQTEEEIVVYQAYKPEIAKFAVENQKLGGASFGFQRMSWIKPNFLWMMYRCGWAEKENQEHVLAIWIKKQDFELILEQAVLSSFQKEIYHTEEDWKLQLSQSEVRLQWDPDHDPKGNKLERKAIQIGMKGEMLHLFANKYIQHIEDITTFVRKQKLYVDRRELEKLLIPKESIFTSLSAQRKTHTLATPSETPDPGSA